MQEHLSKKMENQFISLIQFYPSIFPSYLSVLSHMLLSYGTGYEWKKGQLIKSFNISYKNKKRPCISRKYAIDVLKFGDQSVFTSFSNWCKEYSPLFNIPNDVSKEWKEIIKYFIYHINIIPLKEYQLLLLSHEVKTHGLNNPTAYLWYIRIFEEFKQLRKYTNQLAYDLDCPYYSVDQLHDSKNQKKRDQATAKIIKDILDKADKEVPKAKEIIQKRDAKELLSRYDLAIFKEVIAELESVESVESVESTH